MAGEGNIGAGYHTPYDSTSEFSSLAFIVRQMMARLDTMKPVKVVGVTGGGGAIAKVGTVDVQPLVSMVDGSGNAQEHGTIYGIPWMRIQGGGGAVIIDPKVGDVGFMIAADRDISNVKGQGTVTPGSERTHDVADSVYVGSIYNDVPDKYVRFDDNGIKIADSAGNIVELKAAGTTITDKNGNVIEMSATGVKITPVASTATIQGNLVLTGNLQLGGAIQANGGGTYAGDLKFGGEVYAKYGTGGQVGLSTHKHTQPADSAGNTQAQTNSPTGGT